ncbi:glycosyltransferase family 4 protein [Mangrovimonas spongiae]|uniref:Glycosyltransferase n=1 Tax=Mangrovimonas spongiae TaxID=2494697 RepID=A0A3R9NS37_9FLAO|nr:glycosyltransferase family 4 protein [Mangrovimonas spongiae]RSK40506.1 glycosyltransferase [Mangrovimonas spongiae]
MKKKQPICINYIFQGYPTFYQPYIPPVISALSQETSLKVKVKTFKKGTGEDIEQLPAYYYRRLYETFSAVVKPQYKGLNYLELKALQQQVDVIHVMDSYLNPKVYGLLQQTATKRPKIVLTLRGGDTYVKPWVQPKWTTFYKTYGNLVDAFIVMSNHQKQYLHTRWKVDLARIHVIPISYGVSEKIPPKQLQGECLTLVSAFRMCWEKNIEGNIRVVKHLVEQNIPVHYHIYGDGPDSGQVFYLIDKYNLQSYITYHGRIPNEQLKLKLKDYDIFLQLSHSEAFPTSVLEAQSLGLPAIVSDAGGMPEVIGVDKSGFSVPSYNSELAARLIIGLFKNSEKYKTFSKAAIDHVQEQFSVAQEVERLTNLYINLSCES